MLSIFLEKPEHYYNVSIKAAIMLMNRFCVDEEAGFELSGIYRIDSILWEQKKFYPLGAGYSGTLAFSKAHIGKEFSIFYHHFLCNDMTSNMICLI